MFPHFVGDRRHQSRAPMNLAVELQGQPEDPLPEVARFGQIGFGIQVSDDQQHRYPQPGEHERVEPLGEQWPGMQIDHVGARAPENLQARAQPEGKVLGQARRQGRTSREPAPTVGDAVPRTAAIVPPTSRKSLISPSLGAVGKGAYNLHLVTSLAHELGDVSRRYGAADRLGGVA